MRKLNLLLAIIALIAVANTGFAQGITGSKHDFKAETWNAGGEICIVCHTPHNANTSVSTAPLWNHAVTATAAFTLYSSGTLNATMGQPDGSSKLCLSCHDGTVALENFGGTTGGTHMIPAASLLGTNLTGEHPVSFTYDAALATADGGLKNPTTATGIGTGTIQGTMLNSNKMQCSSCHDVHNSAGISKLLVKANTASALCLTCHSK
jgi:predicted CXXCH cytochrome family protein